jgi:hypothetical protein
MGKYHLSGDHAPTWGVGTMTDHLPTSVRYVKNGRRGKWRRAAKANRQVHASWRSIPMSFCCSLILRLLGE